MTRPVILVDLDNVVYNWTRAMAEWLEQNNALQHKYHKTSVSSAAEKALADYDQWAVWDSWEISKGEFMRWWRLGIEEGVIYGKGALIRGARRALWDLSDAEWHIHLATSRLTKFGLYDQVVKNTQSWLRDTGIPFRSLTFTDNKKLLIGHAIVDDKLSNMDLTGNVHGEAFHFGAPHNNSTVTWDEIVSRLVA